VTHTHDDAPTVELSAEEASAVGDVVASYARAVPPGREQPYVDLLEALEAGTITGPRVATLEQVCALALETGQARRIGLAEVETLVSNVYRRTPGGRARVAEVKGVNEALAQLAGQELRSAKLTWTRPGRYTFTFGVTGFNLTLVISPDGLEVQNLTTS
jgi:hypothetical protein